MAQDDIKRCPYSECPMQTLIKDELEATSRIANAGTWTVVIWRSLALVLATAFISLLISTSNTRAVTREEMNSSLQKQAEVIDVKLEGLKSRIDALRQTVSEWRRQQ